MPGICTRPASIQRSFQSSSDRNDPRGADGLSRIACHARSLTLTSDVPDEPASAFCGPAMQMSIPHSDVSSGWAPIEATASTTQSAPCARTILQISAAGFTLPLSDSPCTNATSSIEGSRSRAAATSAGSTASRESTSITVSSAPSLRSSFANQTPYVPELRQSVRVPGRTTPSSTASSASAASACTITTSSSVRRMRAASSSIAANSAGVGGRWSSSG